ncbi:cupin domain-containing protein [Chitinophagaceae bacterium MMS25-I14]
MVLEKFAHLGTGIKLLRTERGLSAGTLALKAGMEEQVLLNVENFRTIPDILQLNRIAVALDVPLTEVIGNISDLLQDQPYILLKKDDHEHLEREDSAGIDYRVIMTRYIPGSVFSPTVVTIRPGVKRPHIATNAVEFVYVISGSIITGIGQHNVELTEGDVLFYDARQPHSLENPYNGNCVLLSIYLMHE